MDAPGQLSGILDTSLGWKLILGLRAIFEENRAPSQLLGIGYQFRNEAQPGAESHSVGEWRYLVSY